MSQPSMNETVITAKVSSAANTLVIKTSFI